LRFLKGTQITSAPDWAEVESTKIEAAIYLKYSKIDSLENSILRRDSITNLLFNHLKELSTEIDSLQIISKSYNEKPHK
jgi:hypothetical protein